MQKCLESRLSMNKCPRKTLKVLFRDERIFKGRFWGVCDARRGVLWQFLLVSCREGGWGWGFGGFSGRKSTFGGFRGRVPSEFKILFCQTYFVGNTDFRLFINSGKHYTYTLLSILKYYSSTTRVYSSTTRVYSSTT